MKFGDLSTPSKGAMLISMCFQARNLGHIAHLQTTSYAQHIALCAFYTGIITLVDLYAEAFQGRFGIIGTYPTATLSGNGIEAIKSLRMWIDMNRKDCGTQPELQNEIDNIVNLCNSTIYKLENLH